MASNVYFDHWQRRIEAFGGVDALCPVTLRLLDMLTYTGFDLIQFKKLRILATPGSLTALRLQNYPCKKCEVFVAGIPMDVFEDELVPVFDKFGRIFEIRIVISEFKNVGYCFIKYFTEREAKHAVDASIDEPVRLKNKEVTILPSRHDARIKVLNLPYNVCKRELLEFFSELNIDGIIDVCAPPEGSKAYGNKSYNFCYLDFNSEQQLALAMPTLYQRKVFLHERHLQFQAIIDNSVINPSLIRKRIFNRELSFSNVTTDSSNASSSTSPISSISQMTQNIENFPQTHTSEDEIKALVTKIRSNMLKNNNSIDIVQMSEITSLEKRRNSEDLIQVTGVHNSEEAENCNVSKNMNMSIQSPVFNENFQRRRTFYRKK